MTKWIRASERKPEGGTDVLICYGAFHETLGDQVTVGWWHPSQLRWYWQDSGPVRTREVTHWAELPKPPEKA